VPERIKEMSPKIFSVQILVCAEHWLPLKSKKGMKVGLGRVFLLNTLLFSLNYLRLPALYRQFNSFKSKKRDEGGVGKGFLTFTHTLIFFFNLDYLR
jgi:hypothetical protein